jgi:hypothetical protein
MERVLLAAVAVNKAADYYSRADEIVAPQPAIGPTLSIDHDETPAPRRRSRPSHEKRPRPKTTLERLHEREVELDESLERSYERFRRGEITAAEMDRERDQLIEWFNRQVMNENIRYRSMLRHRG